MKRNRNLPRHYRRRLDLDARRLLDQPHYLNQMLALETTLSPRELMYHLHDIERREGRTRTERWASRTLDLDIVCFDGQTVSDPDLRVPHPGLADRDFWQRELAELRSAR